MPTDTNPHCFVGGKIRVPAASSMQSSVSGRPRPKRSHQANPLAWVAYCRDKRVTSIRLGLHAGMPFQSALANGVSIALEQLRSVTLNSRSVGPTEPRKTGRRDASVPTPMQIGGFGAVSPRFGPVFEKTAAKEFREVRAGDATSASKPIRIVISLGRTTRP